MAERHEVLRWTYHQDATGHPFARLAAPGPVVLPVTVVPGISGAERMAGARRIAAGLARVPFQLTREPVWRADLLRLADDDHVLLLVIHHIAVDHWSLGVLARDISRAYGQTPVDAGCVSSRPAVQYGDYVRRQQDRQTGPAAEGHARYWRHQLAGSIPANLPGDRPPSARPPTTAAQLVLALEPETTARLRATARVHRVTPFVVLLAGFGVLLSRSGAGDDVAVGAAIADRGLPEFEDLIGFMVNTVVLRIDLGGDPTFTRLLRQVQTILLAAHEHQDLPFEEVVRQVAPSREAGVNPLFSVGVSYLADSGSALRLGAAEVTAFDFDPEIVRFDLDLFWRESSDSIGIELAYSPDRFDIGTVRHLLARYARILAAATHRPEVQLSALEEAGS